ncbi:MAG: DUF2339 domain-containing protein [Patescibacteria group bacterium]
MSFILIVVLFIYAASLGGRISKLEKLLEKNPNQSPATSSVASMSISEQVSATVPTMPDSPSAAKEDKLWKFISEDFLVKLGALLLVLAFGWVVSYAFAHNWIGPVGRIVLGIAAGMATMTFATVWLRTHFHQGGIFMVLGLSIFNLTLFAARFLYGFLSPEIALGLMYLAAVYVTLLAVFYRSQRLVLASLFFAGVAPLLTAGEPDFLGLFSYLIVLVLSFLWVVYVRGWHAIAFASLVVVALYSVPYVLAPASLPSPFTGLLFAFLFTAIFTLFNSVSILRAQSQVLYEHIVTGLSAAMFVLLWILQVAATNHQVAYLVIWSIFFFALAFVFLFVFKHRSAFYLQSGVAIILLFAATALKLDGPVLTLAYTVETGILVLFSYALLRDVVVTRRLSWLFIGPVLLSFESIVSAAWQDGFLHEDFFILLVLTVTLGGVGLLFRQLHQATPDNKLSETIKTILYTAGTYALMLLWLTLHAALASEDTATTIALIIYTICGLAAYIHGRTNHIKHFEYAGILLLTLVVGRLLIIDIWKMELFERIVTFFLIGALLISTAFYGRTRQLLDAQKPSV